MILDDGRWLFNWLGTAPSVLPTFTCRAGLIPPLVSTQSTKPGENKPNVIAETNHQLTSGIAAWPVIPWEERQLWLVDIHMNIQPCELALFRVQV